MSGEEASLGDIAIVGMAGRFPKSPDIDQFWQNLRDGVECVRFFSEEELLEAGVDPALARDPNYVPAQGWLDDIDLFDAEFFDMSPREAEVTDPQFRFFLECAWEALENAGYDPARFPGAIGVIAGVSNNAYVIDNLITNPGVVESMGYVQTALGNHTDFLSTRIAYKFDLRGPAVTIQTACSTSLVAVHMACQSLLSGESDAVLAGGVCITALKKRGYLHVDGGTNTSDGHIRTFDAKGDGMLGGNGVGVVVLKRMEDALEAGDTIRAVIKGTAINNDGAHKVSFTAPSIDGQSQVVMDALDVAGVDPETITMVEAHGTATPLGDPIEIRALTQAWRNHTDAKAYCAIGSAKTNLGHLDIASGVTGLIKTTLSLQHKAIPPSLHFETPNPEIDFAASPFFVNTELRPWETDKLPRRAALSSFGMGGTNAHAIVEEAPAAPASHSKGRAWQVLTFAAKSEGALEAMPSRLADHLEKETELNLADAAHTLHVGRAEFALRRAVVCRDRADAITALRSLDAQRATKRVSAQARRPVAFLFSGQGSQYANMSRGLYESEAVFRAELDRCAELFQPHLEGGRDLRELLFPTPGNEEQAGRELSLTQFTQPALFAVEYALAQLWISIGIQPESMLGHSIGEYVAATLAEVFSLEDACKLVAARGKLIGSLPEGGTMLAVHADESDVTSKLSGDLSLAAINAPGLVVVSGPEAQVAALEERLDTAGIGTRRLHTSHAFHSSLMDPILDAFRREVESVSLSSPSHPIVSCTTGLWLRDEEATDPGYWVRHLREPVRFAAGVATLTKDPGRALLEVGPGETLASLAKLGAAPGTAIASSMRHPKDERDDSMVWLRCAGELWAFGVQLDWEAFHRDETLRRVPLPAYPFQRRSHWIEAGSGVFGAAGPAANAPKRADDLADWFYVPAWKQSAPPVSFSNEAALDEAWLLFADEGQLASSLRTRIEASGAKAICVKPGSNFADDADGYRLDPGNKAHYGELFAALQSKGSLPTRIVHLWGADVFESTAEAKERCFYSLLFLAQELAERDRTEPLRVGIITRGLHDILAQGTTEPTKALVLGPAKCMNAELENVVCQAIDLHDFTDPAENAAAVYDEVRSDTDDPLVAFAAAQRWIRSHSPVRIPEAPSDVRLRENGTYLVTGGLGGIGLCFAEHLASSAKANLCLLGRTELPDRGTWDAWLKEHPDEDPLAVRIRGIRRLEQLGATVMTAAAQADDAAAMADVVRRAKERFGEIHGVIHAAGVVGAGVLAMKTREEADRVLAPKLQGTDILLELFGTDSLDFLVFVSSIATAPGVLSGVDYASANAYLDAHARAASGRKTLVAAYNWDAWKDVGIVTHASVPDAMRAQFEESMRFAIGPDEGREAFARLLATDLSHVYVTPLDLVQRDDFASLDTDTAGSDEATIPGSGSEKPSQPRPELDTEFVEPETETQKAIAGVWSELLGIAPIGITDSFFELGGNSLVMMQLNVRLRALFGVSMPIRELFDAPQVIVLAERIDSIRAVSASPSDPSSGEEIEEFTL